MCIVLSDGSGGEGLGLWLLIVILNVDILLISRASQQCIYHELDVQLYPKQPIFAILRTRGLRPLGMARLWDKEDRSGATRLRYPDGGKSVKGIDNNIPIPEDPYQRGFSLLRGACWPSLLRRLHLSPPCGELIIQVRLC